ncbi:MAG TPA: hypothetical protein VF892_18300 [Pseudonocardiaceae bacterium]
MAQQTYFERPGQDRTDLDRIAQHRQRLLVLTRALTLACPAQQGDRVIQAPVGIPAVRVEQRQPPGEQFDAEWRSGQYLHHRW